MKGDRCKQAISIKKPSVRCALLVMVSIMCWLFVTPLPATATDGALPSAVLDDFPSFGWVFVKMMVVLCGIIAGLLILAKWLLPRLGARGAIAASSVIEVVDVARIEPRRTVYLIRVGGQFRLVGSSENGLHNLADGALNQEAIASALEEARQSIDAKGESGAPKRSFLTILRGGATRSS